MFRKSKSSGRKSNNSSSKSKRGKGSSSKDKGIAKESVELYDESHPDDEIDMIVKRQAAAAGEVEVGREGEESSAFASIDDTVGNDDDEGSTEAHFLGSGNNSSNKNNNNNNKMIRSSPPKTKSRKKHKNKKGGKKRESLKKRHNDKSSTKENLHPSTPPNAIRKARSASSPLGIQPQGTPETVNTVEESEMDRDNDTSWYTENEYYASVQAVQKLRSKDTKDIALYVDDYDDATFQIVIENLLENTSLVEIKVYRLQEHNNKRVRTSPQMARLFSSVRALRHLKTLELCNMERSELEMITSVIKNHPTLRCFKLHFTRGGIMSNSSDNHNSKQQPDLDDDQIGKDFLWSLVHAPLISDISLEIHKSFPIRILLESKKLKNLQVSSDLFKFKDDHFVDAMQLLEHNTTLQTLDLRPRISNLGMRALSFAVDENKGLKTLHFNFHQGSSKEEKNHNDMAGKMLLHLLHALTRNSTLIHITNYSANIIQVHPADETKMMELLESNQTVEVLDVFDDRDIVDYKKRLLKTNKSRNNDKKAYEKGGGSLVGWFRNPCGPMMYQCGDDPFCNEDFEGIVEDFDGEIDN